MRIAQIIHGQADKGKIDEMGIEAFQQMRRISLAQIKGNLRIAFMKSGDDLRQQGTARGVDRANRKASLETVGCFLHLRPGVLGQGDQLLGPAFQQTAGLCQNNMLLIPLEKLDIEFLFQGNHLLAEWRLRDMQAPGGLGDKALLGNC